MLRQDPIRRKRGELNLKSRLVAPTLRKVPPASLPALPAPKKSEYEQKLDGYEASRLFALLLSDSKSDGLVSLVEKNLQKARQNGDDIYTAVFEGISAAIRNELSEAVRCYHRAFDLAEASDAPPDGFLYSLAWSLFAGSSAKAEVSELLERARIEAEAPRQHGLQEIAKEFRQLPSYASAFEAFHATEEARQRRLHRLLTRPSRFTRQFPLLLFPKRHISDKDIFRTSFGKPAFGGVFLFSGGHGTAIDPDGTFWDELYRLGGSLRDLDSIVLTGASRFGDRELLAMVDLFETYGRKVSDATKPRFYVTPEIADRHDSIFHGMAQRDLVESVTELDDVSGATLPGGDLLFVRQGLLHLKIRVRQEWRSVRLSTPLNGNDISDSLPSDVSVFTIQTQDDLFLAADQARRDGTGLAVFDVPMQKNLWNFERPVREFLGPKIPLVPIGDFLVCDLQNRRFLDAIRSFHSDGENVWTAFDRISYSFDADEFVYFAAEDETRFFDDKEEILDMLRSHRLRRRGLYFTS